MGGPAMGLYRAAARLLLPRTLREEYAHELEQTVAARLAAASGLFVRWGVLVAEIGDLARTAVRERRTTMSGGPPGPARQPVRRGARMGGIRMGGAWSDIRTSARGLMRRPGLALGVTLTVGLGIGATTTIYGVVDGVILRPLPFEDPGRLAIIGGLTTSSGTPDPETGLQDLVQMSSEVYKRYRERARSFSSIGGLTATRLVVSSDDGIEEQITSAQVTPEVFDILGASPALGRAFLPEEYAISQERVVMLSHEYWQARYGGDPNVLGRPLESSPAPDQPRSIIVGVLQEGFRPPETFFPSGEAPQVYGALPVTEPGEGRVVVFTVLALGRLGPGATVEQARVEAAQLYSEMEGEIANLRFGPGNAPTGIGVNGLHAQTVGTAGRTLWIFLGAAGLLLALTAMNAATLMLARTLDRGQELAVRAALGARRARVILPLVVESTLLSLVGGVLGVAFAYGGTRAFLSFAPRSIPRLDSVTVDGRVLAAAALMTLATAFVAGLLPALRLTGRAPWQRLQGGGRSVSEPGSSLRVALVGGQLALAVVLLSGAGLLFGSFMRLRATEPGFEPEGLVIARSLARGGIRVTLGPDQNPRDVQIERSWEPALRSLGAVPGVESMAAASALPFQAPTWAPRLLLPEDGPEIVREGIAGYVVTPGYFETMGARVVAGRPIEPGDGPDGEPVVVVNEAFVRTQLAGREALGTLLRRTTEGPGSSGNEVTMRVVGIVEDAVQARAEDGPRPAIYIPYGQADFPQLASLWAVARTSLPSETLMPDLRRALAEAGSFAEGVGTMEDRMLESRASPRFQAALIGAFALVAMLLAAVGLHGSLAHAVRRRQRELGVRIALGADRGSVIRMVLSQGLRVSAVGLAIGIAGTMALSRVLRSFLYGVAPYDPLTLTGVAVVLMLVSAAACLAPARRATAVDPVRVLSAE
jgi:putative ABC transport system permease protein